MHRHGHQGGPSKASADTTTFFGNEGPRPRTRPWGTGEWGGPRGFGGGRRRRMRRGDVRAALLVLLDEQPHTGYSLMEELERRSNGAWRPSPGSVYPTLQQLEDEGLIAPEPGEGRTPYAADRDRQDLRRRAPRGARRAVGEAGRGHRRGAARAARAGRARSARPPSRSAPRATTPRSHAPRSCSRRRAAASTRSWPTTTSRRASPATASPG